VEAAYDTSDYDAHFLKKSSVELPFSSYKNKIENFVWESQKIRLRD
jgi:hypothetical protein